MTNKIQTSDVFTPTTPARLTFVEREIINNRLVNALRTPGKQIIVYGHSGSGKTTLLENKLYQIYENHITTRCIKGLTVEQLILDAFDQLGSYYESEKNSTTKLTISPSIAAEYSGIKAQIGLNIEKNKGNKHSRILPPQLTPQTLARLLGEAECCWMLEDFHKVDQQEKIKLAQVMKVFMDMADKYRDLKIIALGAVNTARQVVESDAEMRNRVAEIFVPLMSEDEINQIIEKGEALLNFEVLDSVKNGIVKYSNGLASVCHQLCLNICFSAEIYETLNSKIRIDNEILQNALSLYIEEASDTIKSVFDRALRKKRAARFDNTRLILSELANSDSDGATFSELYNGIKKKNSDYLSGNLTHYLKELQEDERGAIIVLDSNSGKYYFSDPIYRVFALALFEKKSSKKANEATELNQINIELRKLINDLFNDITLYQITK